MVERRTVNPCVLGSSPRWGAKFLIIFTIEVIVNVGSIPTRWLSLVRVHVLVCSAHGRLSPKDIEVLTGISRDDCLMCCYKSKKFEFVHSSHAFLNGAPFVNLLTK